MDDPGETHYDPVEAGTVCHDECAIALIASLRAKCDALRAALKDANDLCRSTYAIAERNGEANWPAFRKRLGGSLERQHRVMYPVYPEQYVGAPRKEGERA